MTTISTPVFPANAAAAEPKNKTKNQAGNVVSFDALMTKATAKAGAMGFAGEFLDKLLQSAKSSAKQPAANDNAYPFSSAFESVFGNAGPLVDFINLATIKLNLSAEQNLALQTIAVNNKDITHTPANVQKIAAELKQAGIG